MIYNIIGFKSVLINFMNSKLVTNIKNIPI